MEIERDIHAAMLALSDGERRVLKTMPEVKIVAAYRERRRQPRLRAGVWRVMFCIIWVEEVATFPHRVF
jgi:hypothetical protein